MNWRRRSNLISSIQNDRSIIGKAFQVSKPTRACKKLGVVFTEDRRDSNSDETGFREELESDLAHDSERPAKANEYLKGIRAVNRCWVALKLVSTPPSGFASSERGFSELKLLKHLCAQQCMINPVLPINLTLQPCLHA